MCDPETFTPKAYSGHILCIYYMAILAKVVREAFSSFLPLSGISFY